MRYNVRLELGGGVGGLGVEGVVEDHGAGKGVAAMSVVLQIQLRDSKTHPSLTSALLPVLVRTA